MLGRQTSSSWSFQSTALFFFLSKIILALPQELVCSILSSWRVCCTVYHVCRQLYVQIFCHYVITNSWVTICLYLVQTARILKTFRVCVLTGGKLNICIFFFSTDRVVKYNRSCQKDQMNGGMRGRTGRDRKRVISVELSVHFFKKQTDKI